MVRAPGCGPGGHGFKSRYSPSALESHKNLFISILPPHRLVVRTQDFHSCNRGSSPLGEARDKAVIFDGLISLKLNGGFLLLDILHLVDYLLVVYIFIIGIPDEPDCCSPAKNQFLL